eukprot:3316920-Pyramimonas_sp.AAC.1
MVRQDGQVSRSGSRSCMLSMVDATPLRKRLGETFTLPGTVLLELFGRSARDVGSIRTLAASSTRLLRSSCHVNERFAVRADLQLAELVPHTARVAQRLRAERAVSPQRSLRRATMRAYAPRGAHEMYSNSHLHM